MATSAVPMSGDSPGSNSSSSSDSSTVPPLSLNHDITPTLAPQSDPTPLRDVDSLADAGPRAAVPTFTHRLNPNAAPFYPRPQVAEPRIKYTHADLLALKEKAIVEPKAEPVIEAEAPTPFAYNAMYWAPHYTSGYLWVPPGVEECVAYGGTHAVARDRVPRETRLFLRQIGHKCSKAFCNGTKRQRHLHVAG